MTGRLVLASGSRFRRAMLEAAGIKIDVIPGTVDEPALRQQMTEKNPQIDPGTVALRLAEAKAMSVSSAMPDAVVIGADQVLAYDGRIYSKPDNRDQAREQLSELRGRKHSLPTACVLAKGSKVLWSDLSAPALTMRNFSQPFLDAYLDRMGDDVTATVGGYQLEGLGAQLFELIEGDYFTILGLQLLPLMSELRRQDLIPS